MTTPVTFPVGLPYPITISKFIAPIGKHVEKGERLFVYKFWYMVDVASSPDEADLYEGGSIESEHHKKSIRESIEFFDAPFEGDLMSWNIDIGDEIVGPNQIICELLRPCNHDIVYANICTVCGKEVDDSDQVSANLTISHTDTNLRVSRKEAQNIGSTLRTQLLKAKKLILVVDLDQTVIHCGVDPTIGEWKNNPASPNFETLKDVKSFCLEEEPIIPHMHMGFRPAAHKFWYYVKVRPGLKEFFEAIAPLYELHIYTMATRAYAQEIANIIDPDKSLFGDRILSRDENGSLTHKSLERLFPTDQTMVVIIDDRGDVWEWSPNLIKVSPYNFFVGIGDINSNFLPRQQTTMLQMGRSKKKKESDSEELISDILDTEKKLQLKIDQEVKRQEENLNHQTAVLGEEASLQNNADDITKKIEYSASLEVQQQNRPLAELQKHMHNQQLLTDDDDELYYLKDVLIKVQKTFYERLQATEDDGANVKIQTLMPELKQQVFKNFKFVFSGLIPLKTDIRRADIVLWTSMFGAQTNVDIDESTTHVITKTPGTYKARVAKAYNPNIKVVHPDWIFECLSTWKRLPEKEYELEVTQPATEKELNDFKLKLKQRKERLQMINEQKASTDIFNETEAVDLFAGGASWLIDDDEDEFVDSDEDNGDEDTSFLEEDKSDLKPEYDEFAEETTKKRVHEIDDQEEDNVVVKKAQTTNFNIEEESDFGEELFNALEEDEDDN